jgi:hypothetical protein
MKYNVELDSDAMIYIPSFVNIGSGIQTYIGVDFTHNQTTSCKLTLIFPK